MVVPHAGQLDRMPAYAARTELIPGGVRLTVTAEPPDDPRGVAAMATEEESAERVCVALPVPGPWV
jgi:hypothetical protein